jgi:hypothetical protein
VLVEPPIRGAEIAPASLIDSSRCIELGSPRSCFMLPTAPDKVAAEQRLSQLQSIYGLPDGCVLRDTFYERTVVAKLELFMVGLVSNGADDISVTGAAADEHGFPVDRAFFELIERLSIFLARSRAQPLRVRDARGTAKGERECARVFPHDKRPELLRTSLSNGVALHGSWPHACEAALCELIERDRVLRSFAGEWKPAPIESPDRKLARSLREEYTVEAYTFGPKRRRLTHVTAGMFLLPRKPVAPLAYGFGAAKDIDAALAGARREALQRLAFLWGEELPCEPPRAAPTPDYHQEYYLYPPHHGVLLDWLAGKTRRASKRASKPILDAQPVSFVDLQPPGLGRELAVAKAVSPNASLLRFGAVSRRGLTAPHPVA